MRPMTTPMMQPMIRTCLAVATCDGSAQQVRLRRQAATPKQRTSRKKRRPDARQPADPIALRSERVRPHADPSAMIQVPRRPANKGGPDGLFLRLDGAAGALDEPSWRPLLGGPLDPLSVKKHGGRQTQPWGQFPRKLADFGPTLVMSAPMLVDAGVTSVARLRANFGRFRAKISRTSTAR